jgi:hypothetical protein
MEPIENYMLVPGRVETINVVIDMKIYENETNKKGKNIETDMKEENITIDIKEKKIK